MREKIKNYIDQSKQLFDKNYISIMIIIGLLLIGIAQEFKINNLESYNMILGNTNQSLTSDINKLEKQNKDLVEVTKDITDELDNAKSLNEKHVDTINKYRKREELHDKYEYVIYNKEGIRTDLTYDQIQTGEELMLAKGLDPDLLFGSIMVESDGKENAKSSISTASGYGQFLNTTGKFVYEDLLGNDKGIYDHTITPFDGDINIKMMVAYYDYLYKQTGNTFSVIRCYSGGSSSFANYYLSKINSYTKTTGSIVK